MNLFYRKLQPLLLFGKIIGVCCIKLISLDAGSSKRTVTVELLLAIIVRYGLCMYSVIESIRGGRLDIEEQLANLSNILATVICFRSDDTLIRMMAKLDDREYRHRGNAYGEVIICLLLCVHMSGIYNFIEYAGDWHGIVKFICVVYHKCTYILIIVMFLLFAGEIRRQFSDLNGNMKRLNFKIISERNIESSRLRYEFLIGIVEDLNHSIGLRLVLPIFAIPAELLMFFYRLVFENKWQMSFLDYTILIVYFTAIHSVASIGSNMKKISYESSRILSSIPMIGLTSRTQVTINLFQEHICARPVEINAAGFFNVDKQLITSVLLSVTTYCTVILQIVNTS